MPTGREGGAIAYYSLLRWTPDPLLGESINVGLLMISEDGRTVDFRRRPFRGRASAFATSEQVDAAEGWVESFDRGAKAQLERDDGQPIALDDLRRWSSEGVGSIRFAEPVAIAGSSIEGVWDQAAARFLGTVGGPHGERETGRGERMRVVRDFVGQCRGVPSLRRAVRKDEEVQGNRLVHRIDVAIQNGHLAAVAHAIPFAHGSVKEVDEKRALLVEAALDLPEAVQKIALYDLVPDDRMPLLEQTRLFIDERLDGAVQLRPRAEFPELIAELSLTVN
jgi:Protein of unknown function (DUF3037)